jgi:hypothetical protein
MIQSNFMKRPSRPSDVYRKTALEELMNPTHFHKLGKAQHMVHKIGKYTGAIKQIGKHIN